MSLSKEDTDLENARMCGLSYELNPRNFEDRWYGFWILHLNKLCRRLDCDAFATAQDSLWAGNSYKRPVLADIETEDAGLDRADDRVSRGAATADDVDDLLDIGNIVYVAEETIIYPLKDHDSKTLDEVVEEEQVQDADAGTGTTGAGPETREAPLPVAPALAPPYAPSGSTRTIVGGNQHRVPDMAINAYYSPDFTPSAMMNANRNREQFGTVSISQTPSTYGDAGVHASQPTAGQQETSESLSSRTPKPIVDGTTRTIHRMLKERPPLDPEDFDIPCNPIELYNGYFMLEYKLVNVESKRFPSRQGAAHSQEWSHSFDDIMSSAQIGNMEQVRVFFSSPQWQHQNSILLLATTGDFYTHTIATRKTDSERSAFTIKPWSLPTWVGSDASNHREDKIVAWLNTMFKPDEMASLARGLREAAAASRAQQRQATPPEEGEASISALRPAPGARLKRKRDDGRADAKGKARAPAEDSASQVSDAEDGAGSVPASPKSSSLSSLTPLESEEDEDRSESDEPATKRTRRAASVLPSAGPSNGPAGQSASPRKKELVRAYTQIGRASRPVQRFEAVGKKLSKKRARNFDEGDA
ncbi:hypothetical protein HDZ31DRAFT_65567 [Schizophyllum fasciatum]